MGAPEPGREAVLLVLSPGTGAAGVEDAAFEEAVGNVSGPFWPQPASASTKPRPATDASARARVVPPCGSTRRRPIDTLQAFLV